MDRSSVMAYYLGVVYTFFRNSIASNWIKPVIDFAALDRALTANDVLSMWKLVNN